MDRIDALILTALALLDLGFLLNLRWNRGRAMRIERRTARSLRLALQRRAASDYRNAAPNCRAVSI
jgi:hypothetical protein